jgi:site-specific recombinase XerD
MRVRSAPPPATDADLLDAFRRQLMVRDLAPATIQAYTHDLARFHAWLAWVHEDAAPLLTQVRTIDLAAFRMYLIHEQAHAPATVNRRLQGLRLFFPLALRLPLDSRKPRDPSPVHAEGGDTTTPRVATS